MIEIRNLSKSYDGKKKACNNMNLQINDGEIMGILGPNGAGKSTLLKMIVGILQQDEGEITINGKNCKKIKRTTNASLLMSAIAQTTSYA